MASRVHLAGIGRDIVALCLGAKNVVGFLEWRELALAQARFVGIICRNKKLTRDPVRFAIEVAGQRYFVYGRMIPRS